MPDDEARNSPEDVPDQGIGARGPVPGRQLSTFREERDYFLAGALGAVIALTCSVLLYLGIDSMALGWSLLVVGFFITPLALVIYFRRIWKYRRKRVFLSVLLYFETLLVLLLIGTAAYSPYSSHAPRGTMERGACQDNMRTIDSAIMQYEAAHGEGVYPRTVESLYPDYLRGIPEEPSGGMYYLDLSRVPPRSVCTEGHTY
jgi:hypothetical protein